VAIFDQRTKLFVENATVIDVNFCQAPRLELPLFKLQSYTCFWAPAFCHMQFFVYYEPVFHSVTNNKMTLNDIHDIFIWIEQ